MTTQQTHQSADERLLEILDHGSTCVLVSIGHELGLFDTLADLPPATSTQIADAAGLDERYVREWLGGMTTSRLIDFEPADATYRLCADSAPFLVGAGPDNLARIMRYVTMMGAVAPLVVEAFRTGGGLAYEDYPHFHDVQGEDSAAVHDATLLEVTLPLTGLVDRLREGIRVADVGCGQGHAINLMARAFPASRFTGWDFSEEALATARAEASVWGLRNADFITRDVATLPDQDVAAFDLVTAFDAIHDQAQPAAVLANVHRALRPDGTFLMVDMFAQSNLEDNLDLPWATFLYAVSTTHCMSVSLGQGGAGLGTVWGVQTAERMLREAGFGQVERHEVEGDPFNAYFLARQR
ncbi:class I SAM-dependent methyltransferase [Ornithinimicrobium ciconiae]|uniref:Class I SAM-dependent methyltransferase n=1 Tax=Ornithinimicrobium ciconiae TaxID=2594265 RepID=A0A516GB19_9MICO|nr:class I SAM-dependent methyltransferase [Ornithinimicrobium ciconiae]QDO88707.1 class I SAM-dependent methyltransferase [Ornithinimicrobium ciconiae]